MSLGFGVGDIMVILGLARKVRAAYKDAPDDYTNISDEVKSLQIIIKKAVQHFESSTLSENNLQEGQEVLRGCQKVLEDLNALIENYNPLASTNTNQIFQRIRLGTEDVTTLRVRLITHICLLNSFIQSCELFEIQARLTDVIGPHSTNSRVSTDSITSFAGSLDTKNAYKSFCKGLYNIGVTAEMISQREGEIHEIFKPQTSGTSSQTDDSTLVDQSQSSDAETSPISSIPTENESKYWSMFGWVRRPIDFLVGPLLLAAAGAGNSERLVSILEYVSNINFEGDHKETALHKAASKGHTKIVEILLSRGASTEVKNYFQYTPLNYGVGNDQTSTAGRPPNQTILKGASSEAMNTSGNTPLHLAAWGGHTDTVELLLSKGALIEAKNNFDYTSLHLASREGHTSTVELLLANGASINAKNFGGNNALHHATWKGHTSTVELLLLNRACIRAENKNKSTPLHHAAWGGHTKIVELLLTNGAPPIEVTNTDDYTDDTPLHLAARKGHTKIVELLLANGAPIEVTNKDNYTPLHLAVSKGHTDVVKLLENRAAELATLEAYNPYLDSGRSNGDVQS